VTTTHGGEGPGGSASGARDPYEVVTALLEDLARSEATELECMIAWTGSSQEVLPMAHDEELRYTGPDLVVWDDIRVDRPWQGPPIEEQLRRLEPGSVAYGKDHRGWWRWDHETRTVIHDEPT
jgi:hypothetical protein